MLNYILALIGGAGFTLLIVQYLKQRDKEVAFKAIEKLQTELKIKNAKYKAKLEREVEKAYKKGDKQREALALDRSRLIDETERDVGDAITLLKSALDRREGLDND